MQKIIKGDTVKMMLGKDNGKTGQVLKVMAKESKVLVEGVNMFKRHVKASTQYEGGIIELMKPVNLSNVELVCPNCEKNTRVGFKVEGEKKVRICKKCNKVIENKKEKKS